ncbi:MAG: FAD-binding protein [Oscillospiraceae bacterium]|nr:FAD-binding protein [Oscillospiraceae bacterium]
MKNQYDVVIIGTGIAGLYTSANISNKYNILLITKDKYIKSNSYLAQGGIAASSKNDEDIKSHIKDSLKAGNNKNNIKNLNILIKYAEENINNLITYGVDFDKDSEGNLLRTLEGGHSKPRILHYKDYTGKEITSKLFSYIKLKKNIYLKENTTVINCKKIKNFFEIEIIENNKIKLIYSKVLVISTGGIGQVFKYTTNSCVSTGDGIVFAKNMGAKIKDISLIQFHPTAFINKKSNKNNQCLLLSEALRGEGAILLNKNKQIFMEKYTQLKELAPRDIVSRSILKEVEKQNSNDIFLSIKHKEKLYIKKRFPYIYKKLLENGYDISKEDIPIFPCQHYLMGGIEVDENSKTNIENLYAVGEVSNTGVHGTNRLASNSLLEAIVFSKRAAIDITKILEKNIIEDISIIKDLKILNNTDKINSINNTDMDEIKKEINNLIQESMFVNINIKKAIEALKTSKILLKKIDINISTLTKEYIETKSIVSIALMILEEVVNNNDK